MQPLKGHNLLRAQIALIKYLNNVRRRGGLENEEIRREVDTAQLRAMVRAEPENVLNFLQQAGVRCDVNVGDALLKEYGMFHELVALYASHGMHRRALELLLEHG